MRRAAKSRDSAGQRAEGQGDGCRARVHQRADARRNRAQILLAAEICFAEQGVGVPIDDIARRAGVGVGTVYRHFPTKEALAEAVVVTRVEKLVDEAKVLARATIRAARSSASSPCWRESGSEQAGPDGRPLGCRHRGEGEAWFGEGQSRRRDGDPARKGPEGRSGEGGRRACGPVRASDGNLRFGRPRRVGLLAGRGCSRSSATGCGRPQRARPLSTRACAASDPQWRVRSTEKETWRPPTSAVTKKRQPPEASTP